MKRRAHLCSVRVCHRKRRKITRLRRAEVNSQLNLFVAKRDVLCVVRTCSEPSHSKHRWSAGKAPHKATRSRINIDSAVAASNVNVLPDGCQCVRGEDLLGKSQRARAGRRIDFYDSATERYFQQGVRALDCADAVDDATTNSRHIDRASDGSGRRVKGENRPTYGLVYVEQAVEIRHSLDRSRRQHGL